ncbi:MAG: hypothetical protein AABY64_03970 [Bdellovibrionota bacterium]
MKFKKIGLICLLPLILVSCMKKKDKTTSEDSTPRVNSTNAPSGFKISYEIISGEDANFYSYRFLVGANQTQLFVKKTTAEGSAIDRIQLDINGQWLDQKVPLGDQTSYEFGYFQQNEFKSIEAIAIPRPHDLVLTGVVKWSQIKNNFTIDTLGGMHLKKFRRLYLEENAVFLTEGENLNLYIEEFYAKKAELQTWPEGQKAAPGKIGRSGGQVIINTESASGKIHLTLRGENGADGEIGKTDPSLDGLVGLPGNAAETHAQQPSCRSFCLPTYTCLKPATAGLSGGPGRKGYKGGTGLRGGNSGFVLFKVSKKFDLIWNLNMIPGLGGEGGQGGPGGQGGTGGQAGDTSTMDNFGQKILGPCPKMPEGPKGPAGDLGDNGETGQAGIKEVSCFTEGAKAPICL